MITIRDLENSFEKINTFADELINLCKDQLFANNDKTNEVILKIKHLNRILSYYVKVETDSKDIHFARGRIIGIAEVYSKLLSEYQIKQEREEKYNDIYAAVNSVSHGSEILGILSKTRGMQHKALSRAIGIDDSTLTGIMDKLVKLRVADYNKIGKFKFYYLSDTGQKYKCDLEKQEDSVIKLPSRLKDEQKYLLHVQENYYSMLCRQAAGYNKKQNFMLQSEFQNELAEDVYSKWFEAKKIDTDKKDTNKIKNPAYMPV